MDNTRKTLIRRYVARSFLAIAGAIAGMVALNYFANPYFAFGLDPDSPFSHYSTRSGTRIAKAEIMRRLDYDTVVLGSSRVLIGIDPESRWLEGHTGYNGGLRAGLIVEAEMVFDHALANQDIDTAIVFVDFAAFASRSVEHTRILETRFHRDLDLPNYYTRILFSREALRHSLHTLGAAIRNKQSVYTLRGWKSVPRRSEELTSARERFDEILIPVTRPRGGYLRRPRMGSEDLAPLLRIAERCQQENIRLLVAFSPLHATYTDTIHQLGNWEMLEDLKRKVLDLTLTAHPDAVVWDFQVFTPETGEPIGDFKDYREMTYYSDASHFTAAMGDLCLRRMVGDGAPEHFGARLTPATIDPHLAQQRAARDAWEAENPQEVARLKRMIEGVPVEELPPVDTGPKE